MKIVYNVETNELGILETVNGCQLVRIIDDGNIFKAYLDYRWEIIGVF